MRELDALLVRFLDEAYSALPPDDKRRFGDLLELPDPDLHAYLIGRARPGDPSLRVLLDRIRTNRPT